MRFQLLEIALPRPMRIDVLSCALSYFRSQSRIIEQPYCGRGELLRRIGDQQLFAILGADSFIGDVARHHRLLHTHTDQQLIPYAGADPHGVDSDTDLRVAWTDAIDEAAHDNRL